MAIAEVPRFVRADGPDKVTGSGRYAADINLTGQLVAKFRYAGVSHARITKLDTSAASAMPGVFAVDRRRRARRDLQPGRARPAAVRKDVVRFEGELGCRRRGRRRHGAGRSRRDRRRVRGSSDRR